jgi:hypothetical protein
LRHRRLEPGLQAHAVRPANGPERLAELSSLMRGSLGLMAPEYIAVWRLKPVPALDDEKPTDLLARGDYRRVARLISEVEEMPIT